MQSSAVSGRMLVLDQNQILKLYRTHCFETLLLWWRVFSPRQSHETIAGVMDLFASDRVLVLGHVQRLLCFLDHLGCHSHDLLLLYTRCEVVYYRCISLLSYVTLLYVPSAFRNPSGRRLRTSDIRTSSFEEHSPRYLQSNESVVRWCCCVGGVQMRYREQKT